MQPNYQFVNRFAVIVLAWNEDVSMHVHDVKVIMLSLLVSIWTILQKGSNSIFDQILEMYLMKKIFFFKFLKTN